VGRACSTNGEKRNASRVFVGKPEGKRSLRRRRRRWEGNIKILELGGMDWFLLAENRDR
jgi:hypothetical protein